MDHGNSCSHLAFFLFVFVAVALAAKHKLVCSSSHARRIATADEENLVNVSSNGRRIVNLTRSDLVWCGHYKKYSVTMMFSEPVLVTAIAVNGWNSSYVSQFKLSYKETDKFVLYKEFKIHSSESQEFSLSPAINATDFRFGIQEFNESSDLYCWHIDMFGCLSTEAFLYESSSTTTTSITPITFSIPPSPTTKPTATANNVPTQLANDQLQIQLDQIFIISIVGLVTSAVMTPGSETLRIICDTKRLNLWITM